MSEMNTPNQGPAEGPGPEAAGGTAVAFASRDVLTVVDRDPEPHEMLNNDGERWQYAVATDRGTIFADSATGILGVLIPGYADIPQSTEGDQQATVARWEFAAQVAQMVQERVAGEAEAEGLWDSEAADEDVLTPLFQPKDQPVEDLPMWAHPVPLVLIWTDYSPYTERLAPRGNVWWIDPSDELSLLKTLHEVDVLSLMVSN